MLLASVIAARVVSSVKGVFIRHLRSRGLLCAGVGAAGGQRVPRHVGAGGGLGLFEAVFHLVLMVSWMMVWQCSAHVTIGGI